MILIQILFFVHLEFIVCPHIGFIWSATSFSFLAFRFHVGWKGVKSHLDVPNNVIYRGCVDTNLNAGYFHFFCLNIYQRNIGDNWLMSPPKFWDKGFVVVVIGWPQAVEVKKFKSKVMVASSKELSRFIHVNGTLIWHWLHWNMMVGTLPAYYPCKNSMI